MIETQMHESKEEKETKSKNEVETKCKNEVETNEKKFVSETEIQSLTKKPFDDSENHRKSFLLKLFVYLFLDLLSFTVILPLLPSILEKYKEQDASGLHGQLESLIRSFRLRLHVPEEDREKVDAVLIGGLLGSLLSFLQFLAAPLIGALSDTYGRKPLLLVTVGGGVASYLLWFLASESFAGFLLSRVVLGLSKGNVHVTTAMVSDVTKGDRRTKGMIVVGLAFAFAFTIGPLLGATVVTRLLRHASSTQASAALVSFCLSFLALVFVAIVVEETLDKTHVDPRAASLSSGLTRATHYISPASLFQFKLIQNLPQNKMASLQKLGQVYFLFLFCYSGLEFNLTFLTHHRFGFTGIQQGKLFCFVGILMCLIQGGFTRRVRPGHESVAALSGLLLCIPAFLIVGFASSVTMTYVGLAVFAFPSAVVVPCLTAIVSHFGDVSGQKGTLLGVFRSLGSLARAFGPVAFSSAYWLLGPEASYLIGAAAFLVPAFVLRRTDAVAEKTS